MCSLMRGKRGWIRILEATIAVLIVSAAMIAVSLQHPVRGTGSEEYAYGFQRQILSDIAMNSSLRLLVLNVEDDEVSTDPKYVALNEFVGDQVPGVFGYLLRVCDLPEAGGSDPNFCKMTGVYAPVYLETKDFDVFVEDIIISADLGDGHANPARYDPKRVRLFFWDKV